MNDEVLLTRETLENSEKLYKELELNNKKLQLQISEAEERFNLHLTTLQEALQSEETSQKELTIMRESFDSLQIELQSPKRRCLSSGRSCKFMQVRHKCMRNFISEMLQFLSWSQKGCWRGY